MRLATVSAFGALLVATGPAATQGFGVYEHGSCMMGRAGAGIAAPCDDGSGIFFNPAGLTGRRGFTLSAGITGIKAFGGFTDDFSGTKTSLTNGIIPVPHLYLTYGINERLTAGVGMFVPYGLGTVWPETFEGRFNGYDNDLSTIYVQPTVAFRPHPMLAIGGGVDLLFGRVKLTQRVDLSAQPVPGAPTGTTFGNLGIPFHTDMASAALDGNGSGVGGHVGILIEPNDRIAFGARYLMQAKVDYTGTVDFTQIPTNITLPPNNPLSIALGLDPANPLPLDIVLSTALAANQPLADGNVTTSITMPAQIVAGMAVRPTSTLLLLLDWQMVRWSAFDTLTVAFSNAGTPAIALAEDFEDTHGIRAAFEWMTSPKLALRSGFIWHQAAAPDQTVTPLLPEGERNEVVFGIGYALSQRLHVDAAYQFLRQQKRRGRVQDAPINTGLYDFNAHLVGFTLTARF